MGSRLGVALGLLEQRWLVVRRLGVDESSRSGRSFFAVRSQLRHRGIHFAHRFSGSISPLFWPGFGSSIPLFSDVRHAANLRVAGCLFALSSPALLALCTSSVHCCGDETGVCCGRGVWIARLGSLICFSVS